MGVHPHDADGFTPADLVWLRELAAHPRVVAVGECGLDHHRDHARPEAQRRAFSAQIGLAREVGLPLVVHTRDAADETLDMLGREADDHPVVLHCFSMPEHLDEVADRGYLLSFAGQVTYPRSDRSAAAAREAPGDLCWWRPTAPISPPSPAGGARTAGQRGPHAAVHRRAARGERRGASTSSPPETPRAPSAGEPGVPGARVGVMRLLAAHGLRPDTELGPALPARREPGQPGRARGGRVGPGDMVLEVGAGLGVLTVALARAARNGARGRDRPAPRARRSHEVLAGARNVRLHWGDAMRLAPRGARSRADAPSSPTFPTPSRRRWWWRACGGCPGSSAGA